MGTNLPITTISMMVPFGLGLHGTIMDQIGKHTESVQLVHHDHRVEEVEEHSGSGAHSPIKNGLPYSTRDLMETNNKRDPSKSSKTDGSKLIPNPSEN